MARKNSRKVIEAQEFVLKNEAGDIIAVLEATGIGTPIMHMFHANGAAISFGIVPDGSAFVEVNRCDGSRAISLATDRHGGVSAGVSDAIANTPIRFRCDKDGGTILEVGGEIVIRGTANIVFDTELPSMNKGKVKQADEGQEKTRTRKGDRSI